MQVIGKTEIQETEYSKTEAFVCIISINELKKVADKAGYQNKDFKPPVIGVDYQIAEGYDFRSELTQAIKAMQDAYEKFAKVAPVAAKFAGIVLDQKDKP